MPNYHLPNILLVDDDEDDIELFKEALYIVSPKSNFFAGDSCNEAVYMLEDSCVIPDLIFMDLNMYGTDGFNCIRIIKANDKFKDIPMVVLSSIIIPSKLEELYQMGVKYFITKPVTIQKLQAVISKMVNTPLIFENQTRETFHYQDF